MIPESTFWYDPRMWDDTPTDDPLGNSLKFQQEIIDDVQTILLTVWRKAFSQLSVESPFKEMYREMMEPLITMVTNVSNPALRFNESTYNRKATIAEKVAIEGREVSFRMTHLGGMVRVLDHELNNGVGEVETLRDEVYSKLIYYDQYLHDNFNVTQNLIKNNVAVSISSIIHSAIYAITRLP
jgi:hypothetical protein